MDKWWELDKDKRRKLKCKLEGARSERVKARVREEYRQKDKEVKRSMRNDKRQFINDLAEEAERAASSGQMKEVYGGKVRLLFYAVSATKAI